MLPNRLLDQRPCCPRGSWSGVCTAAITGATSSLQLFQNEMSGPMKLQPYFYIFDLSRKMEEFGRSRRPCRGEVGAFVTLKWQSQLYTER
jgi:hypothetical protein